MVAGEWFAADRLAWEFDHRYPDSPIGELNRLGAAQLPPEVAAVLEEALSIAASSDGAFDPTVLPLVGLFKEVRKTGKLPDQEKVKEILQVVDYRHIVVEDRTVKFSRPGVTATLDAVAKGYIVDEGIKVLLGAGCIHLPEKVGVGHGYFV